VACDCDIRHSAIRVTLVSKIIGDLIGVERELDLSATHTNCRKSVFEAVGPVFRHHNRSGFPITGQAFPKPEVSELPRESAIHVKPYDVFRTPEVLKKVSAHGVDKPRSRVSLYEDGGTIDIVCCGESLLRLTEMAY